MLGKITNAFYSYHEPYDSRCVTVVEFHGLVVSKYFKLFLYFPKEKERGRTKKKVCSKVQSLCLTLTLINLLVGEVLLRL